MNDRAEQLTDRNGAPVEIRLLPGEQAYGLFLAGEDRPVGRAYFLDRDSTGDSAGDNNGSERVFHHTVVEEEFGGRGLAGLLVAKALDDAREQGRKVVPVCSYVSGWIKRNNWDGPVNPVTEDVLDWVADQG